MLLEEVFVEGFLACLDDPAIGLTLFVEHGMGWSCFDGPATALACVEGPAMGSACLGELTTASTGVEPDLKESVPTEGTDGRGLDECTRVAEVEPDDGLSSGLQS